MYVCIYITTILLTLMQCYIIFAIHNYMYMDQHYTYVRMLLSYHNNIALLLHSFTSKVVVLRHIHFLLLQHCPRLHSGLHSFVESLSEFTALVNKIYNIMYVHM